MDVLVLVQFFLCPFQSFSRKMNNVHYDFFGSHKRLPQVKLSERIFGFLWLFCKTAFLKVFQRALY